VFTPTNLFRALVLLLLAGPAAAQNTLPPAPVALTLAPDGNTDPVAEWPRPPAEGSQTSFRIRHNKADGTVVGMSLQQSRYPAFLLQLEVVPPGQYLHDEPQDGPAQPIPRDDPSLRTIHKLSLRFRF
jgi:hypothetical protein